LERIAGKQQFMSEEKFRLANNIPGAVYLSDDENLQNISQ
jgi:hypothetical protein